MLFSNLQASQILSLESDCLSLLWKDNTYALFGSFDFDREQRRATIGPEMRKLKYEKNMTSLN